MYIYVYIYIYIHTYICVRALAKRICRSALTKPTVQQGGHPYTLAASCTTRTKPTSEH